MPTDNDHPPNDIRVLHLSDLHFTDAESATLWHGQLSSDLKYELKCDHLDAVIISGDVGTFSVKEEYDEARRFLELLGEEFGLKPERLILVPGNHDLNWELANAGYAVYNRKYYKEELKPGTFEELPGGYLRVLTDKAAHRQRFSRFAAFHQQVTGRPYPTTYKEQGVIHRLPGLIVMGLNSSWKLDEYETADADIHPGALASALTQIRNDPALDGCHKLAVWHHPLHSKDEDRIKDHGFMDQLAGAGFSLALHGHIHKAERLVYAYDAVPGGRRIQVIGAGTFGAPAKEWVDGVPLQYHFLKLSGRRLVIRSRRRVEINGKWTSDPRWEQGPGKDSSSRLEILLPERESPESRQTKTGTEIPALDVRPPDTLDAEIADYREKLESLHERLPLKGFRTPLRVPIKVADIYVPLRAMIDRRATGRSCFADAEDAEANLREAGCEEEISVPEAFQVADRMNRRGIVILGDPGSGKTTHLKRVLLWCLQGGLAGLGLDDRTIPVFLPLRELSDLSRGLDAFIESQLDLPHLETPAGFGRRLLKRGRLLFLFDGLDEVADPDHRARVSQWIDEALTIHKTCRFVVTCRFAGYTDDARLDEAFLEMHIRPLTADQADAFIRNWYRIVETGISTDPDQAAIVAAERADDLIERLGQPEFRARRVFELTRNPLLLTNICLVHRDRGNLPHTRAQLYEECTDVLLELWRGQSGIGTRLTAKAGRRALQPAAFWLHEEEGRTRASGAELAPVIEPALKAVGWPHGDAETFLKVVRDESGLLTGWGGDQYGFMHLGFQEYLAAREIRNRAFADPAVIRDLAGRFGESWWQEVTLLLLALEEPSMFGHYMKAVVRHPLFAERSDLVEMCLDDAAEVSPAPFIELLKGDPGDDPSLWARQLVALRMLDRLDPSAVNGLTETLKGHPHDRIRQWLIDRADQAAQESIISPKGGVELVWVPGGRFLMGSPPDEEGRFNDEGPQHEVHVPGFFMGRYPVTNEEYGRFLADNRDAPEPKFWGDRKYNQPSQPVVGVSWDDAQRYAQWAGLRLPSETEWEYACRAGTTTRYYTGDSEADLDRAGWYGGNSGGKLHPVGEKEPNAFGLYDMHGNVFEWVEDDWHENYDGAPADGGPWIDSPRGSPRVLRGGSWYYGARDCRSSSRNGNWPDGRNAHNGFRLVFPAGQRAVGQAGRARSEAEVEAPSEEP